MKKLGFLLLVLMVLPGIASAWWQDDWSFKKKVTLDMTKLKSDNLKVPEDGFVLLRLHTGNFMAFTELSPEGKDIRILAEDETTPLKFYIEKLDLVNEMALIWVKLPKEAAASPQPAVWLYYGNAEAVAGQDEPATYQVSEVLSYQFSGSALKDSTANANNPVESTAAISEGGLIGGAGVFNGSQQIKVKSSPSLAMAPATGWTVSTWVKFDQPQQNTVLIERSGINSSFALTLKEQTINLEVTDSTGVKKELAGQGALNPGVWHQVTLTATADTLTLYLNGNAAGSFPVALAELTSDITIGADANGGRGFSGVLDQINIYKVPRDANAIKFDFMMQGVGSSLLTYEEDQTPDSEEGESYFVATMNNVTVDGWVVIGILAVMFVISWIVMIGKGIVLSRVNKENKKFEQAFSQLDAKEIAKLNSNTDADDEAFDESPLLFSLTSDHKAFSGSSIYRIYHVGVEEMNKRLAKSNGQEDRTLSSGSMAAVKASMDAVLVREMQRLNSQMVLLTIAISGGPFLGLLGTVVGVMITFAAIALSGEVNVNSIAPGIAAALAATVAGLAVAIPALFGYNYLGSQIKVVAADMQVFVDEFVAKLAEQHT